MPIVRTEAQIMEKIRLLLDKASNTSHEQERESFLAAANAMMTRHAIDQAMLDNTRTTGEKRVATTMRFKLFDATFEWKDAFTTVMFELTRTNRCRMVFRGDDDIIVVGMQEDVEWTQMLWMNVFFEFVSKVNPSWKKERTMGQNVLAFKEAGWKWEEIWKAYYNAVGGETEDGLSYYDPKKASYLMREYKKELRSSGREAVATQRHGAYRASFVRAFADRISYRLEVMRAQNKIVEDETSGSAVALLDVSHLIDEEYYKHAPWDRPLTDEERVRLVEEANERSRRQQEADAEFLASLSPQERKTVLHEREKEKRRQARVNDAYWRERDKLQEKMNDTAGFMAGRTAADTVSLNRSAPAAEQANRKELA